MVDRLVRHGVGELASADLAGLRPDPDPAARPARQGRRRAPQRGQETLQAILVVSMVLIPVLFSILTLGSVIHVYIGAQAAAATGARAAGSAGEFGPQQRQRVVQELRANGIEPGGCSVEGQPPVVGLDQAITVTVRCPQEVGIPFLFTRHVDLASTFVARGEVNR